ncbi:hypothetical protein [Liquorilactobacillus nagelii]|uniref:hypothetical protein n=1 Tax=Liquorilactobacillus nagelii TaxID=82688 RepID=UPI0039EA34D6
MKEEELSQVKKELNVIFKRLRDWDGTGIEAEEIFKANSYSIERLKQVKIPNQDKEIKQLIQKIGLAYDEMLQSLRDQKIAVKRQLLELTYSRGALKSYLNQNSQSSLLNFNM